MIALLGLNGWRVHAEIAPLTELVLAVAERKPTKADAAVFFRRPAVRRSRRPAPRHVEAALLAGLLVW